MSGFVAAIADEPSDQLAADVSALATQYETCRGNGLRLERSGGRRVQVVRIQSWPSETTGSIDDDDGWLVHVGRPRGANIPIDLARLDGQFALVTYHAVTDEAVAAVDPFAIQALYMARRAGITYLSTSAIALARHVRAKPSWLGLTSFLRAGYHFGTMTHWEGIERLQPGEFLRVSPSRRERGFYWRPTMLDNVARMNLSAAVDEITNVLVDTAARYYHSATPTWLDLTGGYDTRLLALVLEKSGVPFITDTRETALADDVTIAATLARLKHWEWQYFPLPANWSQEVVAMVPLSVAWADGALNAIQLSRVLWPRRLMAERSRSLLFGVGGGHLRNHAWRQEFLSGGRTRKVNMDNWLDMRMLHPMPTTVFRVDPTPEVRADMRARMSRWAEPYRGDLNTAQLDVMFAYKNTGHGGAYLSADNAFMLSELPYYARDVFTAAFSVNPKLREGHGLMRHMINRLDPAVAKVMTETGGPAQPVTSWTMHRHLPYYAKLARKALHKLIYRGFGKNAFGEHYAVIPLLLESHRAYLRHSNLRVETMRAAPLYDGRRLAQLVAATENGDLNAFSLLNRIITVERALGMAEMSLGDE